MKNEGLILMYISQLTIMFALQKPRLSTYNIPNFFGHVLQYWKDVCVDFTLISAKFLLHIELPCPWHV
jgi:hypothetical protein